MAKAIVISHPSEIVRKGLLSILENEINASVFGFEQVSDVKDNWFITYTEMVFILSIEIEKEQTLSYLKTKNGNITLVGISTDSHIPISPLFDGIFHINDIPIKIIKQLKNFFTEFENENISDELTTREKEVLRLIALGYTNKSIAETLYISTHTVISHRKNITDKLGIKSIPGLTVYALIQKIISQEDITSNQMS